MSVFQRVALEQIAQSVEYGVTASAINTPVGPKFLRITDIQDDSVNWDSVPWCDCREYAAERSRLKCGDIVFARTGATTGKSFLIRECPPDAVFASYLIRVRLRKDAEPRYVNHFFHTRDYWSQIMASRRGVAQPGVNASTLKALKIPLPTLLQQRRIAEVLDRAEALQTKRRAALAQLNTLTQSVFLELFGDPGTNSRGWPISRLAELCREISDIDHKMPKSSEGGVPFISAKDLTDNGRLSFENVKRISHQDFARLSRKSKPERGDIIYSRIGVNLGKARLVDVDFDFLASYSCCTIKPNAEFIDPVFLCAVLDSPFMLRQAQRGVRAIAVPDLGLNEINSFRVPVPPRGLQSEFRRQLDALGKLRATQCASENRMNSLSTLLKERAFRGEL